MSGRPTVWSDDPEFPDERNDGLVAPGTRVRVRNRFDGQWAHGFEVAEAIADEAEQANDQYRLRRLSDGTVLPTPFSPTEITVDTHGPNRSPSGAPASG